MVGEFGKLNTDLCRGASVDSVISPLPWRVSARSPDADVFERCSAVFPPISMSFHEQRQFVCRVTSRLMSEPFSCFAAIPSEQKRDNL